MTAAGAGEGGRLIVLVGPAGAGKTTIAHRLIDRKPARRGFSVSHTTRPMRTTETNGVDYWFVERSAFEQRRDSGGFAEWAEVHGHFYGTSLHEIDRMRDEGRDALFDIDIVGALNLYRQLPDRTRLAFLLPPSWPVLVDRLLKRGTETETTVRRRLRTARRELEGLVASSEPWHVFINDALEPTVEAMESLFAIRAPLPTDVHHHVCVQAFLRDARLHPLAADEPPPT